MEPMYKPYIQAGYWVCSACATKITKYAIHGDPIEKHERCTYCGRRLAWDAVLQKQQKEKARGIK